MNSLIIDWQVTRADLVWEMIITHQEYRPNILNLHFHNGNEWQLRGGRLPTHYKLRIPSYTLASCAPLCTLITFTFPLA